MSYNHRTAFPFLTALILGAVPLVTGCSSKTDGTDFGASGGASNGSGGASNGSGGTSSGSGGTSSGSGGTSNGSGGADSELPSGACDVGDRVDANECFICYCITGEWDCLEKFEGCPIDCENQECCGGAPFPESQPCDSRWQCKGEWLCDPESDCPKAATKPGQGCTGAETRASNPDSGTCCLFSNPCSVPEGWNSCEAVE